MKPQAPEAFAAFVGLDWADAKHDKQNPKNLSRKGYAPIIREPRGVTWGACISVVFYSGDPSYADP